MVGQVSALQRDKPYPSVFVSSSLNLEDKVLRRSFEFAQCASRNYRNVMLAHQVACSMSRAGDCYDNAVAESFFASLRKECLSRVHFATRTEAFDAIQIDGSDHEWFEERAPRCTLLVFIDDATGRLMELRFAQAESTFDYFEATRSYLQNGKPVAFNSDKASIFRVSAKDPSPADVSSASLPPRRRVGRPTIREAALARIASERA